MVCTTIPSPPGYGRNLFRRYYDCWVISEIKAFAIGARKVCPDCRIILDIGGQDTKAISLNEAGHIERFEMNNKCTAFPTLHLMPAC